MRLLKTLLIGLGVPALALGVLVLLIPWYVQTERFRDQIEAQGSEAFGRPLTIDGEITLRPSLSPRITVDDIRVGNPDWASRPYLLVAQRLELQVDLLALLGGELNVLDVVFEGADLLLEQRGDGVNNFTFRRGEQVILVGDLDSAQLRDSAIAFRSAGGKLFAVEILSSSTRAVSGEPERADGRGRFRGVEFDFSIRGEVAHRWGEPMGAWQVALQSRSPEFNLDVAARIADPAHWAGVTYEVKANGHDTEPLRRLTGVNLPELGDYVAAGTLALEESGYRLSHLSGQVRRDEKTPAIKVAAGEGRFVRGEGVNLDLSGSLGEKPANLKLRAAPKSTVGDGEAWPFRAELRSGERWLVADGGFQVDESGREIKARLETESPDLGLWEPWLGRVLPAVPVKASTQLSYAQRKLVLEELQASLGDLALSGELRYAFQQPRDLLTGSLKTSAITLAGREGARGGAEWLDAPLDMSWLTTLDASLQLAVDTMAVSGAALQNVKLTAALEAGSLTLDVSKARLAGGTFSALVELGGVSQGLAVKGSANVRRVDLGRLWRELAGDRTLAGRLGETKLTFNARGSSRRELLSSAELVMKTAPSTVEYRPAGGTTPRKVQVNGITTAVAPGGPMTVEAGTRVGARPYAVKLQGHTLLGTVIGVQRWPIQVEIISRNARLQATGSVARPSDGRDLELQFSLTGDRFQRLAKAINLIVPLKGKFELKGRLRDQEGRYRFTDLSGYIGQTRFTGSVSLDPTGERPEIVAEFRSPRIYITDYTLALVEDEEKAPVNDPEKVIPEFEIPVEALRSVDVTLKLQVDEFRTRSIPIGSFSSHITLQGGLLMVQESLARGVGGASLSFDFRLDTRLTPPYVKLAFKADNLDYGAMLEHLEITDLLEGRMDVDFLLSGHGATRETFLRRAQGHLVLSGGQGKIASRQLDLWAGDLTRVMLSERWREKSETEINCVKVSVAMENGLATAESMLLDTKDVTVGGTGTLDLPTEKLDVILQPAPKEPSLVSLASPARIHGTLRRPQFTRTKLPATRRSTVASGLLAGLVNPAFLVLAFSHAGEGAENPCVAAVETAKVESRRGK